MNFVKELLEKIPCEEFKLNLVDFIYKKALDNNYLMQLCFSGDKEKINQEINIKFIQIPEGVKSIESDVSFFYMNVVSLILPRGITSIPIGKFRGLKYLRFILIPDSVERIEINSFASCSELTSVTIPKSVNFIARDAFWDCKKLSKIQFLASQANNENFADIFKYLFI